MISTAVRSDKANHSAHQSRKLEIDIAALTLLQRNSQEHLEMNVDELDGLTEDGSHRKLARVVDRPSDGLGYP